MPMRKQHLIILVARVLAACTRRYAGSQETSKLQSSGANMPADGSKLHMCKRGRRTARRAQVTACLQRVRARIQSTSASGLPPPLATTALPCLAARFAGLRPPQRRPTAGAQLRRRPGLPPSCASSAGAVRLRAASAALAGALALGPRCGFSDRLGLNLQRAHDSTIHAGALVHVAVAAEGLASFPQHVLVATCPRR